MMKSSQSDVKKFLNTLRDTLQSSSFNIDTDFVLIRSQKEDYLYSTRYTLADLEYDSGDVIERLKELTVQEYSETLPDRDDMDPPLLFVFGKGIDGKLVYIKIKQRQLQEGQVVCVSFHYAKHSMPFPYK